MVTIFRENVYNANSILCAGFLINAPTWQCTPSQVPTIADKNNSKLALEGKKKDGMIMDISGN